MDYSTTIMANTNFVLDHNLFGVPVYINDYQKKDSMMMNLQEIIIPAATSFDWNSSETDLIIIILKGKIIVDGIVINEFATNVLVPAGKKTTLAIDGKIATHAIIMISKSIKKQPNILVKKPSETNWIPDVENHEIHVYLKELLTTADVDAAIMLLHYPAGHVTEWHEHSFDHAAYVLDGMLVNESEFDSSEKHFAPSSFIYSPKGQKMRHGATPQQDTYCIFITSKAFSLKYLTDLEIKKLINNRN